MKERPILFSTEMVKAILDGRKTQTRRIINVSKGMEFQSLDKVTSDIAIAHFYDGFFTDVEHPTNGNEYVKCPYGKPGDVLWVREKFVKVPYHCNGKNSFHITFPDKCDSSVLEKLPQKPSIHMPKSIARIWLQVETIRVERLQDISYEDAVSEGIEPSGSGYKNYLHKVLPGVPYWPHPYHSFQSLWESIHRGDSWCLNPWLWVVEFKVLSTTGRPESIANHELVNSN